MATLRIDKELADNRFSVTFEIIEISTAENELIEDFGEPEFFVQGSINLNPLLRVLTVDDTTGFQVGETVSAPSSASGTVVEVVNGTSLRVEMASLTATEFADGDTITGGTSAATAVIQAGGVTVVATTPFGPTIGVVSELWQLDNDFNTVSIAPATNRRIPSQFPFTKTFDANAEDSETAVDKTRIGYAEALANDYAEYVKYLVEQTWNELIAKRDTFSGVTSVPL